MPNRHHSILPSGTYDVLRVRIVNDGRVVGRVMEEFAGWGNGVGWGGAGLCNAAVGVISSGREIRDGIFKILNHTTALPFHLPSPSIYLSIYLSIHPSIPTIYYLYLYLPSIPPHPPHPHLKPVHPLLSSHLILILLTFTL